MLLVARSALNLYECAVSTSNADFRLYEFLKNSRVVRSLSLNNKVALKAFALKAALVLISFLMLVSRIGWWRMTGSNRRPPACKAGALPAELIPQDPLALALESWWV